MPKNVYIALMGLTGSGKSSFIKRVIGFSEEHFGHSLTSATEDVRSYHFPYGGYNFILLDTPGFDDSRFNDDIIVDKVLQWLKEMTNSDQNLDGIIYMHRIIDARIQFSARESMRIFRRLCGPDYFKKVIFGTTFWDIIDPGLGAARETELVENDSFLGLMAKQGTKVCRLGYSKQDDLRLLRRLAQNQETLLDARKEMKAGKQPWETAAAERVYDESEDWANEFDTKLLVEDAQRKQKPQDLDSSTLFQDSAYHSANPAELSFLEHVAYSIASSADVRYNTLEQCLASDLHDRAFSSGAFSISDESLDLIQEVIPDLLERFALRIGAEISSKLAYEVTFYLHKHRTDIAHMLVKSLGGVAHEDSEEEGRRDSEPTIALADKIGLWLPNIEDADEPHNQQDNSLEDEPIHGIGNWVDECRDLLLTSSSFSWLVTDIRSALDQTRPNASARSKIQRDILKHLPYSDTISPRRRIEPKGVVFHLEWDLQDFKTLEKYPENLADILERAITLTGDPYNAQALTSIDYIRQTWPKTGETVLKILQALMESDNTDMSEGLLVDNTKIKASHHSRSICVTVIGNRFTIADVGEQLAWMCTALQSSPFAGIASSTPVCSRRISSDPTSELEEVVNLEIMPVATELKETGFADDNKAAANCWFNMFRNPVLVRGFPILKRSVPDSGIEMPINMITSLLQKCRLETFDRVTYLKGFSSMLSATQVCDGQIMWHHEFKADGSYIRYPACGSGTPEVLNATDIARSRNIIGWSPDAQNLTGRPGANYDVRKSGLRSKGSTCILKQITLNAGKIATVGVSCAIGEKDKPLHISANQYRSCIMASLANYFVLWDSEDQRGWLANGADILLHLVRASLWHNQHKTGWNKPLTLWNELRETGPTTDREYAATMLCNKDNMLKKVWEGKYTTQAEEIPSSSDDAEVTPLAKASKVKVNYFRLQDLVEEKWAAMEKMIATQREAGLDLAKLMQRRLEGWDFHDFVANTPIIEARTDGLGPSGGSWNELILAMDAKVLFGRGFGELIQQSKSLAPDCRCWRRVPTQSHYLAAHMADLRWIRDQHGPIDNPEELYEGIIWDNPSGRSNECHCNAVGAAPVMAADCLQNLKRRMRFDPRGRNRKSCHILDNASPACLNGAVLFGDRKARIKVNQAEIANADALPETLTPMEDSTTTQQASSSGSGIRDLSSTFSRSPDRQGAQPDSTTSVGSSSQPVHSVSVSELGSDREEPNSRSVGTAIQGHGGIRAIFKGKKRAISPEADHSTAGHAASSSLPDQLKRRREGT